MEPLSEIEGPAISPERAQPGYVAARLDEIRQTDPRVLAVADALRMAFRKHALVRMTPCQSIIIAHAVVRALEQFDEKGLRDAGSDLSK